MTVRTDQIRSISEAEDASVVTLDPALGEHKGGEKRLVALGRLEDFRCAYGFIEQRGDGIALDPGCASVLGIESGQSVTHVGRW